MITAVTLKSDGSTEQSNDNKAINLDAASVVTLGFGPEEVARFDKVGNDLVLVLRDGTRITISNFFVTYDEERSEIVFVDENDVVWWGQYAEPWDTFQIAEIEHGLVPAAVGYAGLAPLLGLVGAAALAGGGGGSSTPPTPADPNPVAVDDAARVVEAGINDGGNTDTPGTPVADGNVLANDRGPDVSALSVVSVALGDVVGVLGTPLQGTYGTLTLNADGTYTYQLDNDLDATQALASGDTRTETFTYSISDGSTEPTSASLTITVEGTNDLPTIAGINEGAVVEDGVQIASEQLTVSDPDAGDSHTWTIEGDDAGEYGTFAVDETGKWTYTLDNDLAAVQALVEGDTLTDTITVRATDSAGGFTTQEVTVTITGANDTPVIDTDTSILSSSVSGITGGGSGGGTEIRTTSGTIAFTDIDGHTEESTITVEPVVDDGSYLGEFTLGGATDGLLDWTFTVDNSILVSLPEGTVVTQEYEVIVTDPDGGTATEIVTIEVVGVNDQPVAVDDSSIITPDQTAVQNVLDNDTDVDNGETDTLVVTQVDGQPISVGTPVTLSDGSGTVTLTGNGTLTFDPAPGFTGQVVIPYTVDDGSGTDTATDQADWVINVINASIIDNASPQDPNIPDGVLSSIDTLDTVTIDGVVPTGGTVTEVTVTDGTNVVTVPVDTITVETDGTFTVDTDLTGLDDGTLTLELTFEDENGETVSSTDTILKDTVTTVTIDPVDAGDDGTIPTITGTGEPDDTLTLTIDGGPPITVEVGDDGTWSYTPDAPLPSPEVEITVEATDPFGNTDTDERNVVSVVVEDQQPGAPEDIIVNEAGLPDGTDPTSGSDSVDGTLTIGTSDGDITSVTIGGTTIAIADLLNVDTTPIPAIGTTYGDVTITGYDPDTGTISYSYELDDNTVTHMNATGVDAERDVIRDTVEITVVDANGDSRDTSLVVAIADDIPEITPVAAAPVSLEASDATLGTNPSASFAGLFDLDHGADGPAATDGTVYSLEISSAVSGLSDGATGSPIVLTLENGMIVGRVEGSGEVAFQVILDPATGEITLDQQRVLSHPDGTTADVVSITDAAIQLRVTATDGDGDTVTEVANIGDRLSFRDDVPVAVDDTANVAIGSTEPVTGNVIAGADGIGTDDLGADSPTVITSVIGAGDDTPVPTDGDVVITGTYGDLTIAADGTYSYTRDENTPGDVSDVFTYTLTDNDGDTSEATLTITIGDAPVSIGGLTDEASGGDAEVNESKLANGTDIGDGDITDSDSFTITAFDGIADLSISQGGTTLAIVTNDVLQTGPLILTTALGSTLEITGFNPNTGEVTYTYTLSDAETHAGTGRDDIFESFGVRLEDSDGDIATDTLSVRILDDIPVITPETGVVVTLEASDATLGADPSASFAGLFTIDHGADDPAAVGGTVYSLEVGTTDSGLIDGATGDPIVLTLEGGVIVGRVDGSGEVAFRVIVDAVTGEVTLDQQRVLSHPDGSSADVVAIADAAIQLTVTATDGDGDVVSETADIGARLTFRDDVPLAEDDTDSIAAESTDPATGNVITSGAGADAPGADAPGLITSVTGSGADTAVADSGNTVITGTYGDLTIAVDGTYSYTRNPNTPGDVSDVFTYTLTDNDGDTDTATLTIGIEDADVSIGGLTSQAGGGDAFVNESKLPGGTGVGPGDDTVNGAFTIGAFDGIADLSITQGGTTLPIITDDVLQSGPLTLTTALGSTLEITGYDPNTGEVTYTYTLSDAETHGGAGRDDIFETFGIMLEDNDGDIATDTLSVRIIDDVPIAENDSANITAANPGPATGNVITGAGGAGADDQGVDSPGTIVAVTGAGAATPVPGTGDVVITGTYGDLTIAADGTYSYTRTSPTPGDVSDVFTYTLRDDDGDTDEATLTIFFGNAPVEISGLTDEASGGDAVVNESKLPDGTDFGAEDDTVIGTFSVTTFNGIVDLSISQGMNTLAVVTNDVLQPGPLTLTTALGSTLEITGFNATTGEVTYEYTLSDAETHGAAGRDDIFESFGIRLEDLDGDIDTNTLSVRIIDDIPVITAETGVTVALEADDATLGTDPAASFAGLFTIDHGADDPAIVGGTVYSLEVGAAASGLVDGATGDAIALTLESGVVVGRTTGGDIAFRVLVDATTGVVTLDQQRVLEHTDGSSADVVAITDAAIQLTVTATDGDGDVVTESADIGARLTFRDDLPVAENDTDSIAASTTGPATGNVITTGAGADDQGADAPSTITSVTGSGADTAVAASGTTVIAGTYGDLTIEADGTYSYTRDPNTAGGVSDVFTYTLTDSDDDTDTATLTIDIGDAGVSISDLTPEALGGDAFVNESKLSDGTDVGLGDDEDSETFTIGAFDGIADLSISQGANTLAIITNDVLQTGPLTLTTALDSTLTITGYNALTGIVSYTYTLSDAETHSGAGRDDIFETFGIRLEDRDGDVVTDTLSVQILDDIPVITAESGVTVSLEVADATLGTDAMASFAGLFTIDHGADEAAATDGTQYDLLVGAAASGLTDGATGDPIVLTLESGVVVGRVDGSGEIAFRVLVDEDTGVVTLDQQRVISHPDGSSADVDAITDNAIQLRVTATDGDGDEVTATADIGARLTFLDDVPSVTAAVDAGFVVPTLTTQDADTSSGTDTASADFSGALEETADFGADGAAATDATVWAYTLSLLGGATSVASALSSDGDAITLYVVGGEVVGSTAATAGAITAGNTAFSIAVDTDGEITLSQSANIDHPNALNAAEVATLAQNLIRLTGTVTITDRDGDTDTATANLDIGDSFSFTDDGPTVGAEIPAPDVLESNLRVMGSTTNVVRDLNIDFGADLDDGTLGVVFDATQTALIALGLTSSGDPVTYVVVGGLLTARAGGEDVFTVELEQPAVGNSFETQYEFTLIKPLDHVATGTPIANLTLPFAITATDGDGDTAAETFDVRIVDDTPSAMAQTVVNVVEGAAAIGSSAGGVNLLTNDTQGADVARIHQVTYNDNNGDAQTVTIVPPATATTALDTEFGTLTVNADGTWTYTPDSAVTNPSNAAVNDDFSYTLIDGDGDISAAVSQPITVTDTAPVATDDTAQSAAEGAGPLSGNVISNDTPSEDGGTLIDNFTYTNTSGVATTFNFTAATTTATVATPTGSLLVNAVGTWIFTPALTFDHDATGALDSDAGSFSYVLVDTDGTTSNSADQPLSVTDTSPTADAIAFQLDEADLTTIGSAGNIGAAPSVQQALDITKSQDDITDVIFDNATVAALPTNLESNGTALVYVVSADGHTLTATAGSGGATVFTLVIGNPTDTSGATQNITATLLGPLDQPGAISTVLNVPYQVQDIDSAVGGTATFTIVDDTPVNPVNDTAVTVVEGAAAVGSANTGANLLTNDTSGADGGQVYDFTYTDASGDPQTSLVPDGGSATVTTQYGLLTVHDDGVWSYTPAATSNHVQATNDTSLSDDFTYRTVDGDGDISAASATQAITVTDTVPVIGTPVGATVDEANLPNGTDPMVAPRTVTGTLDITPGQDTFAATITSQPSLTSNGLTVEYVVAGDSQSLIGYAGTGRTVADQVFTFGLTNPTAASAGYTFTLLGALDHGMAASLDLDFGITATDSDLDSDVDTVTITVDDDVALATINQTIPEDDSFSFNSSADATVSNTVIFQGMTALVGTPSGDDILYQAANGTVTVREDGSVLYTPATNFSGTETFEVRTTDSSGLSTTTVNATVTPVSDAPSNTVVAEDINTLEDTSVGLGLIAPSISDNGTGTGNNPISERIGAITLSGIPAGVQLLDGDNGDAVLFTSTGADITIVLSDVATVTATTGTLTLTTAQYQALKVLPTLHDHDNFTVTAEVTSFEVDGTGAVVGGVAGAAATATVNVSVQAVTDDAELVFDTTATVVNNVDQVVYSGTGGNTVATVTIEEDIRFNLRSILEASYADLDGSEDRSIVITNGSIQELRIAGQDIAVGESITLDPTSETGAITDFANINMGATGSFSGVLTGITVAIVAQDEDSDGFWNGTTDVAGPVDGIAEADTSNNSVTLNLRITPTAGDVASGGLDVTTNEDTPVTFLRNIRINDGTTADGEEVFDLVVFDLPADWVFADSTTSNGAAWTVTTSGAPHSTAAGTTHTITFTAGTQAEQEAVLDNFTITPPAHSSLDASIDVDVTTTDTNTVTGSDTATVTRTVAVTVDPVAEIISGGAAGDTDDDGNADLEMTAGHAYTTPGAEDTWFDLNGEAAFDLSDDWLNQDTDEIGGANDNTYARLSPVLNGDLAVGSQFRWDDGGPQTATFTGSPIQIPVSALATVEFLPPADIAGRFTIDVTAYTEDFDDDSEGAGTPATAESGSAQLVNLDILPVADEVALTLNARASGTEDTAIPLNIRPSSSDPSETFNVTISDIPIGATIIYDGTPFTASSGNTSLIIPTFDRNATITVTPPLNSNEDFNLTVEAVSVDTVMIGGVPVTDTFTPPVSLSIAVAVRGDADEATIVATPQTYTEAALDSGATAIALSDLVNFTLIDADGSETLTVRVSNLREGFDLSEGALLTSPSVTGTDRVWALSTTQLANAELEGPENFSGEVAFDVQSVTTENDGSSLTSGTTSVTFEVTPSTDANVVNAAVLVEDVVTTLNFGIDHQNGDTDETIGMVRIPVAEAVTSGYTLFLGTGGSAVTLAASGVPTVMDGGVNYYVLSAAEAADLSAETGAHLDGALGSFELQYQIIDENFGTEMAATSTTSGFQSTTFALTATPVTDAPDATITAITSGLMSTVITNAQAGDDANPDLVELGTADVIEVTLNVNSADNAPSDGSEHVTRVIIDNVPDGVTVTGAEVIGLNNWLLIFEGVNALPINASGGIDIPVQFDVTEGVGNIPPTEIDMTVQVQDRGNLTDPGTTIMTDTVSWTLDTNYPTGGPNNTPATIDDWSYNNTGATEDVTFALADVMNADITTTSTAPNTLTIQITDLPAGTVVAGMTETLIDGVVTFTASVTSMAGDNAAAVQGLLDTLMASIMITPPANANDNNNQPDGLSFNANLIAKVIGGNAIADQDATLVIPAVAVTDPADLTISVGASDVSGTLTEDDTEIPLSITINNDADGAAGSVVGDTLYVQITGDETDLQTGTLTDSTGTTTYPLTDLSGPNAVAGIPPGNYYVIPGATMGSQVDLIYNPTAIVAGNLTVDAQVVNVETGSTNLTSSENQVLPITIGNNGVTATSAPSAGTEAADSTTASLVELSGLTVALNDNDGSEELAIILLSNVPEGFLVYTGPNAAGATPASNAGGNGQVNTWVIASPGDALPPYVAILPPQNWSGTLDSITMLVASGETTLSENLAQTFPVEDITIAPVANGIAILPTSTFGTEGQITSLNLNASITDTTDATVTANAPDESTETATLEITGIGEFASFYLGTTLITTGISFSGGTHTITGLSQADLDMLGFKQPISALTDQDGVAPRIQIGVTGFTVDGASTSASDSSTVTVNLFSQLSTSGADTLLWTGSPINAAAGEDTVEFRQGEDLTGATVAANLSNVETLDLSIDGANTLDDLTPQQLQAMTDGDDALTVNGTADDVINLDGTWRDNGGGVYDGVIAGVPETIVTLTVTGGVQVTPPTGGFAPPPAPPSPFAFMLAEPDEGFGLGAIERAADVMETPEMGDALAGLSFDALLSDTAIEGLDALLPEPKDQDKPSASPTASPADAGGGDLMAPVSPWEDDLQDTTVYEV